MKLLTLLVEKIKSFFTKKQVVEVQAKATPTTIVEKPTIEDKAVKEPTSFIQPLILVEVPSVNEHTGLVPLVPIEDEVSTPTNIEIQETPVFVAEVVVQEEAPKKPKKKYYRKHKLKAK